MAQERLILTESRLAALGKAKADKEAHGEFESEYRGYCGTRDTIYVGTLKGVIGLDIPCSLRGDGPRDGSVATIGSVVEPWPHRWRPNAQRAKKTYKHRPSGPSYRPTISGPRRCGAATRPPSCERRR